MQLLLNFLFFHVCQDLRLQQLTFLIDSRIIGLTVLVIIRCSIFRLLFLLIWLRLLGLLARGVLGSFSSLLLRSGFGSLLKSVTGIWKGLECFFRHFCNLFGGWVLGFSQCVQVFLNVIDIGKLFAEFVDKFVGGFGHLFPDLISSVLEVLSHLLSLLGIFLTGLNVFRIFWLGFSTFFGRLTLFRSIICWCVITIRIRLVLIRVLCILRLIVGIVFRLRLIIAITFFRHSIAHSFGNLFRSFSSLI